jgi:hypothetical protein
MLSLLIDMRVLISFCSGKLGVEGKYLNTKKAIYDNPTANIVLNGEKLKAFPLRSDIRQKYISVLSFLLIIVLDVLAREI